MNLLAFIEGQACFLLFAEGSNFASLEALIKDRKDLMENKSEGPAFLPLVEACARFGIKRTLAFQLAREGRIDVFRLGRKTYCLIESIERLPTTLKREQMS